MEVLAHLVAIIRVGIPERVIHVVVVVRAPSPSLGDTVCDELGPVGLAGGHARPAHVALGRRPRYDVAQLGAQQELVGLIVGGGVQDRGGRVPVGGGDLLGIDTQGAYAVAHVGPRLV